MLEIKKIEKRVVLICWKQKQDNPVEVFSNLKNLCLSYPQYNYNTLNNYLSKNKIAYENEEVRIERLPVYAKPMLRMQRGQRSILPVVVKQPLNAIDEQQQNLEHWLGQPVKERLSAVTFIVGQSLKRGQRMNKTIVHRKKMKE